MKLNEILDDKVLARRLDVLNKDKPKSAVTLIKLLRMRASRSNPRQLKTDPEHTNTNYSGLTGGTGDTFSQPVAS